MAKALGWILGLVGVSAAVAGVAYAASGGGSTKSAPTSASGTLFSMANVAEVPIDLIVKRIGDTVVSADEYDRFDYVVTTARLQRKLMVLR